MDEDALHSRRVTGAVLQSSERKRMLLQRDPLRLQSLYRLECGVWEEEPKQAVFCGFLLFLTYARFRFTDAQRIEHEPVVEGEYLEAVASRTKTSNRAQRRRRMLSVSAPAMGVVDRPDGWSAKWLALRKQQGLEAAPGRPLMPVPTSAGWGSRALSSHEATVWMRELLSPANTFSGGVRRPVDNLGTHSCKVTLLAWAAKGGLSLEHRKLLGYHTSSADETALLYSRNAMAEPLRALSRLVEAVRVGRFRPDEGRSGTWVYDPPDPSQVPPADVGTALISSSDEDDASSEEDPAPSSDEDRQATAQANRIASVRGAVGPSDWPSDMLYMNVARGTFHALREEGSPIFRCGRRMSAQYLPCLERPAFISPACNMCLGGP